MTENDDAIDLGGQEISLAGLAGISMDQVDEVRWELFARGLFHWQVKETGLDTRKVKSGERRAVAYVVATCMDVKDAPDVENPQDLIGKEHRETFFFNSPEDVGRLKAFLVDTGFNPPGLTLDAALAAFVGHQFLAKIVHSVDRDNKDIKYANFDRKKDSIVPIQAQGAQVAAPMAQAESQLQGVQPGQTQSAPSQGQVAQQPQQPAQAPAQQPGIILGQQ